MTEIKEQLAEYEALLPVASSISTPEAERRAGEFLVIMATIANWRHILSDDKIRLQSVMTAVYAQELSKGQAKTMTENKTVAEASKEYTKAREDFERIENDISFLKTYYEIFNNAHLFYRQMSKEVFS